MKIVGKQKASKTWCMMKDALTGHYFVGYADYWPMTGSYEAVVQKIKEANDKATDKPEVGPEVKWPGFHRTARPSHAPKLTQEQIELCEAYEKYTAQTYALRMWEQNEAKRTLEPLDYTPVFEDELRFVGYTRGRSSVTMQFEASNGQIIEFGPSGIDGLIQGIIDGKCPNIDLEGTHLSEGTWDVAKREYINKVDVPRGRGIKATFKFVKKGANVYAELTEV